MEALTFCTTAVTFGDGMAVAATVLTSTAPGAGAVGVLGIGRGTEGAASWVELEAAVGVGEGAAKDCSC